MTVSIPALVFTVLILLTIMFQAALALGAPWGACAMGGKYPGKFPAPLRWACLVQIAILALLALIVLSKAEMLLPGWRGTADWAIWVVVGFGALSTFLNLITRSVWERRIWAPVAALILITSLMVAVA
ncbi:hypothetical protein [Paenibacillus tepidiphilus]|uniref:hypothetical protein n=1 Tax=Paenibacillus tepidiphilus TaxID=2608683 RepID=UPI00123B21A9|nr:hypothetical protein [Paenibacillus tepidiphilus]